MAIMCTGNGQDEALTNTATSTAAWSMYNLMLEHNATGESIEAAMTAWFSFSHKMAAVKYSEYDRETGRVSLLDKMDGKEIGSESQEAIAEGLLDLTILDKKQRSTGEQQHAVDTTTATTKTCPEGPRTQRHGMGNSWDRKADCRPGQPPKETMTLTPPRTGSTQCRTTKLKVTQRTP